MYHKALKKLYFCIVRKFVISLPTLRPCGSPISTPFHAFQEFPSIYYQHHPIRVVRSSSALLGTGIQLFAPFNHIRCSLFSLLLAHLVQARLLKRAHIADGDSEYNSQSSSSFIQINPQSLRERWAEST